MKHLLTTERLILRRFTEADGDHIYALDNDPEVMRYINGGIPTPRHVIQQDILPTFCQVDASAPEYGFWAAIEKASGDFLGWFSFRLCDNTHTTASIGYRLHQAAWGKGFATEGARALIRKGFTDLSLQHITATTYEENRASRRVMEKVGMQLTRRFRLTPEDIQSSDTTYTDSTDVWDGDDVEYAISRPDWAHQKSVGG